MAVLNEDVPAEIVMDDTGVASCAQTYNCEWQYAVALVKQVRRHPDFDWLLRTKATITREEAYKAVVRIEFQGVEPDQVDGSTGETGETTVFAIEGTMDSEPIEAHPNFKTFAGEWDDASTWDNGAEFDLETGAFKGFRPTVGPDANTFGGVRSFMNPGMIYSRVRTIPSVIATTVGISMTSIGNIEAPPPSKYLPTVDSGRNWLKIGCDISRVGDGVQISERWKLSGPGGWNANIYTDPS